MRSLASLVMRRTLLVGILPLCLASLVTLVMIVRHGVMDSTREATFEASRSKTLLDQSTRQVEHRWREAVRSGFDSADIASGQILLRHWIDSDTGICLLSVWHGDSLEFSHPRRDEVPPSGGAVSWSEVETHPRCAGPVVRLSFAMDSSRTAVVVFRLNSFWMNLSGPLRYPGSRCALLDQHGSLVGSQTSSLREIAESDPILSRISEDSLRMHGWRLEPTGLIAFSSQRLEGPPWWLVARQDVAATLAPLAPLVLAMLVILGLSAWLAFALARSSTIRVLEPLVQLRNSLAALEEGEFEGELVAGDIQEIHQLASTYNRMAMAIQRRESIRLKELESMVSELESFSYSVSHDLRSPLRAIQGYAKILREEQSQELSDDGKDLLERIQTSSLRMGCLIDDLLRLAHASRTPLKRVGVDMDDLVREVLRETTGSIGDRALEWIHEPLGKALGDPGLILQVWSNLISNAVKYSRKVSPARIRMWRETLADGTVWWWIQDNGIGFAPEHAARIFGVFQRLHPQGEFEGTGVGLALVKRIVERHGGQVRAQGIPDAGATIGFSLPTSP